MTYYLHKTLVSNTLHAVDPKGIVRLTIREDSDGSYTVDTNPGEAWVEEEKSGFNQTKTITRNQFYTIWKLSTAILEANVLKILELPTDKEINIEEFSEH